MMAASMIRIVIVDDHELVRRGLATFLRTWPDFVLVGEAANGQEAIEKCERLLPNVVLMDLMMPELDGFTAISILRERFPQVNTIALSSANDAMTNTTAARAGVVGYLSEGTSNDELATVIRAEAVAVAHKHRLT